MTPRYSERLVDHFLNPRNAGLMREPDGVGEDEFGDCGDLARFFLRVRDGHAAEIIAHNFRNGYEVAVDSFGNAFLSDNDEDDGNRFCRFVHVMEGGRFIKTGDKSLALELEARGYDWVAAEFKGKSRVQQHKMVYDAIGERMGGVLHALALTTAAKD